MAGFFQWTIALDSSNAISRGPSLPKETDRCIYFYESLKAEAAQARTQEMAMQLNAKLDTLRSMIENRIEQLEDFYLQHDSEPKAILFEKQRLRLRRLLHAERASAPRMSPPPPPPPSAQQITQTNTPSAKRGAQGGISVKLLSGKRISFGAEPTDTVGMVKLKIQEMEGTPPQQQRLTYLGGELDDDNLSLAECGVRNGAELFLTRPSPSLAYTGSYKASKNRSPKVKYAKAVYTKRTSEKAKKKLTAIYDWEKGQSSSYSVQSSTKYKLDEPFEFQVVLTEKEFFKLTSRRRSIRAEKRHKERRERSAKKESQFLQSTGPYVDPTRISSSIYRSPNKKKWIDPKGLRPYQHV
jgi:hypothetical protein